MRLLIVFALVLSVAVGMDVGPAEASPGIILDFRVVERGLLYEDAEVCRFGILADSATRTLYRGDNLNYSIHNHLSNPVYGNLSADIRSASDPNRLFNLVINQDLWIPGIIKGDIIMEFDPSGSLPSGDVLGTFFRRETGLSTSFVVHPVWGRQILEYDGYTSDMTFQYPAPVPEPSSFLGLVFGLGPIAGLVGFRRR